MKATKLRAVEMVRRIRDRHARQLTGKTEVEIIAFYRAAGEAAMEDLRQRAKSRTRAPANKALQPSSRAQRKAKPTQRSRAARG